MNRHIRTIIEHAMATDPPPPVRKAIEEVLRKPPRSPARQFKPKTSTKEARRQKHREETARIREARMKIAGGRCEETWCSAPGGGPPQIVRCPQDAEHLHHTLGGSGRRREKQTVENTRVLCWFHHRKAHRASKEASR